MRATTSSDSSRRTRPSSNSMNGSFFWPVLASTSLRNGRSVGSLTSSYSTPASSRAMRTLLQGCFVPPNFGLPHVWSLMAMRARLTTLGSVVYLGICLVSAFWAALIGRSKGSPFWIWLIVGFVLPILGVIAAVLYRYEVDELLKQCPKCCRIVPISDALCTRCGAELEFPDVAI